MSGPLSTPDGDDGVITKGKGKYTTQTTTEPLPMCGSSDNKEEKKRLRRGGKNSRNHASTQHWGRQHK